MSRLGALQKFLKKQGGDIAGGAKDIAERFGAGKGTIGRELERELGGKVAPKRNEAKALAAGYAGTLGGAYGVRKATEDDEDDDILGRVKKKVRKYLED